jgi:hypothetical protein
MSVAAARPPRLAMLSGAVFVVLVVVAFVVLGGSTPDEDASARKVLNFYNDHEARQIAAAIVLAASVPFLLIFSAVLHRTLRAFEGPGGWLSTLALAGGVVAGAGFLMGAGVHLALTDAANKDAIGAAHALNFLDALDFPSFALPIGVLVFATGFSTFRRAGALPRWLGWVGVIVGLLVFTPAGFIFFGASGLWILVASIVLYLRAAPVAPAAAT